MRISDINPFIRYADIGNFRPFSDFGYAADCRLFYILDGSCRISFADSSYLLTSETLVIVCPGEKYKFSDMNDVKVGIINFDFDRSRERVRRPYIIKNEPCAAPVRFRDFSGFDKPVILKNSPEFKAPVTNIAEGYSRRRLYYREKASGIMKTLLCDIIRSLSSGAKSSHINKIETVLSYISSNPGEVLDGESLGKRFGYHPYYLSRMVKGYTGKTLKQYVITCRIEEAKKLLKSTDLTVAEISSLCGFDTPAYFSNVFHTKEKTGPAKYRKMNNDYI